MKVKAIKMGYYGHIRQREGAEFTLTDPKHFSSKWMERVNGEKVNGEKAEAKGAEAKGSEEPKGRPRGNPNWKRKE